MWSKEDYAYFVEMLRDELPYTHYFHRQAITDWSILYTHPCSELPRLTLKVSRPGFEARHCGVFVTYTILIFTILYTI